MRTTTELPRRAPRPSSAAGFARAFPGPRPVLLVPLLALLVGIIPPASAAEDPPIPATENVPVTAQPVPLEPNRCDIEGTDHDDKLEARKHGQIICGLGGDDTLIGSKGRDVLRGGPGDDEVRGRGGDDDLFGGDGKDVCHQADGDGTLDHCEKPKAGIAVTIALEQVGDEYQWGEAGPDEFDCSGLTLYAWNKAGVSLPHSSVQQYKTLDHVRKGELRPGDLVFFYKPISHVAMYIGNDRLVHAVNEDSGVRVDKLGGYYAKHFTGAARPK